MAPKRSARTASEPPAKRQAKDASKDKRSAVLSALAGAEGFPESVRKMLQGMASSALSTPSAERHSFQASIIDMVGEVMSSVETQAEATMKELQGRVGSVDADRSGRQDALTAAQQNLAAFKETAVKQAAALQSAREAVAAAKKVLAAAEKAEKSGGGPLEEAAERKSRLEGAKTSLLEPIKGRAADAAEVEALVSLGTDYGFDPTMLQTLPSVLQKDPSARAGFDIFTLEQLDQELSKALAEESAVVEEGELAKRQRSEAAQAAKAAFDEAHAQHGAAKEALGEAQAAEQEEAAALATAKKAVASFFLDTKALMDEYDRKQAWLTELRAGPLVAFKELVPPPQAAAAV
mmetsp:Transcript_23444/g.63764  ORF Transcript_23444/g.63764 Transcript_23444/m.63764 type:complete len:349 (-) Transcript_23444:74-1120(-)